MSLKDGCEGLVKPTYNANVGQWILVKNVITGHITGDNIEVATNSLKFISYKKTYFSFKSISLLV